MDGFELFISAQKGIDSDHVGVKHSVFFTLAPIIFSSTLKNLESFKYLRR